MPRVSQTLLEPCQAILTDTRCLIDSPDHCEQHLAPGLNILCVAAACTCQFPNLSDVLTSVSMELGNGLEVALSPAQQPSLHFTLALFIFWVHPEITAPLHQLCYLVWEMLRACSKMLWHKSSPLPDSPHCPNHFQLGSKKLIQALTWSPGGPKGPSRPWSPGGPGSP